MKYFVVSNGVPAEAFVVVLTNPSKIEKAKAIVSGREKRLVHVGGIVVKKPVSYNRPWRFHLAPESLDFFEMSAEVCDAMTSYVDIHLEEVGGAFLPANRWCPWNSRVIGVFPDSI